MHILNDRTLMQFAGRRAAAKGPLEAWIGVSPHPEGSSKYERLKLLAILVEAYEDERGYRMEPATPQEAIAFMLEQRGMTRSDLASIMGGRSRVSDFFSGKRALSTGQIVTLRALLHIPADLLLPMPSTRGKARPSSARAA